MTDRLSGNNSFDLGLFTGFDDNKKKQKSSLSSLNAPSI